LRFFAALAVVFFHYAFRGYAADGYSAMPYPLLSGIAKYGYLGVDLFFLISGYVIFMTASSGDVKRFFISRVARLYPAFWFCCTLTFLAVLAFGGQRFSASLGQYLVNMTMLSDFVNVPLIDGAYWSLFIEIKFYAMVLFVLYFKQLHRSELLLALWLLVTVVLDAFPAYQVQSLLITHYAPYFVAGAMFFLISSKGISTMRVATIATALAIAIRHALSLIPKFEQHYQTALDGNVIAISICLFFTLMFLVSTRRTGMVGKIDWTIVGSLTYPLYLLHENIGFIIINLAYPRLNQHIVLWGTLGLMLVAAYGINVLIEQRYAGRLKDHLNNLFNVAPHQLSTTTHAKTDLE
jgi:peptidoglycan/LPS O-acetylase OafA/YrhL